MKTSSLCIRGSLRFATTLTLLTFLLTARGGDLGKVVFNVRDYGAAGAQYFCKDGIHYELMTHEPVFLKSVIYDGHTGETFKHRERPFVYVNEQAEVAALFTACLPPSGPARIVVQPVDRYVPGNIFPP